MNEFETKLLAQEEAQNKVLVRIERAVVEQGKTLERVLRELQEARRLPNVIRLARRVQGVEGEVSELRGEVIRLDAEVKRAAGGSDGG